MSAAPVEILPMLEQGTPEWLALRKTKITATDSSVIMNVNPWKTRLQLYEEKIADKQPMEPNQAMKRGTDLEPIARELFNLKTGKNMIPMVVVKDWTMASLDGISENEILEVKCPGERDHAIALSGKIPDHYYPQLQHQMWVCNSSKAYYFSFDGIDGVIVEIKRDDAYIEKMIEEERKFYDCLINRTPPEPAESDYIERNDQDWEELASQWKACVETLKEWEKKEADLREELILLSGERSSRGAGITLSQVQRKGNVEYNKIPELQNIDLEQYRKPAINTWRITQK